MASGSEKFPGNNAVLGNNARTLYRHALSPMDFRTLTTRDIARNEFFGATSQALTLNAEASSYALTGSAATLLRARVVNAETGAYALTGSAATLLKDKPLSADPGAYSMTGFAAEMLRTRQANAEAGSYALTGFASSMPIDRCANAEAGAYAITGADANLIFSGGPTPAPARRNRLGLRLGLARR